MRTNGRRGRGARHAPGPKKPPAYLFSGPNFDKPPSVATPKPTPKPKPVHRAKVGPYTKPVPYRAGHTYRAGQPVTLDSGETVITRKTIKTSKQAKAPKKGYGWDKAAGWNPAQIRAALASGQISMDKHGKLHVLPNAPIAANNLSLGGLGGRVWGGVEKTGSQMAEAAVSIPQGIVHSAGAVKGDIETGNFSFPKSRKVLEETGKGMYYDITHPTERPGFFAADMFALGSMGAGAVSKLGAVGRGVGEAEGSALSRLGAGVRESRKPHYGELTSGEHTVQVPLSRNALVRPFQRDRIGRQQKKLDTGDTHLFGQPLTGRAARVVESLSQKPLLKEVTAEARFGRILRSTNRISNDIGFAPGIEASPALKWATRRTKGGWKTDPAREASLALVGIFGNRALREPAAVIKQFTDKHTQIISDLSDRMQNPHLRGSGVRELQRKIEAQVQLIHAARAAEKILHEQPKGFWEALQATRGLSHHTETLKIGEGQVEVGAAGGRLSKIHEFYGGKAEAPEGSFYFPTHSKYALGGKSTAGRAAARQPGEFGVGPPAGLGTHAWEGKSLEHGIPAVTHGVMEHFNRTTRFTSALHQWEELYKSGTKQKHPGFIPIRESKTISKDLRAALKDAQVYLDEHPDMEGSLPSRFMDRIKEIVVAKEHDLVKNPDGTVEGVKWVDPRFLKDVSTGGRGGGVMQVFDTINNVARVGQLYLRPGYFWNAPQNAVMAAFIQGFAAPRHIYQGLHSAKLYGKEVDSLVTAMAGESRSLAYDVPGGGKLAGASHRLAHGWNKITDSWFRKANVFYNASKAGYHGKSGLERLARKDENGKFVHQKDIQNIANRAHKDSVDFNSMTPAERDFVRRAIYFYPWVSRGSAWVGHAAVQHPVKSAALLHIGEMGQKHNEIWNFLPQWAKDSGIFSIGPTKDLSGVLTINPANMNTPTTVVQAARVVADIVGIVIGKKPTGDFVKSLTPVLEGMLGSYNTGAPGIVEGLPVWKVLQRIGVPLPGKANSKSYPDSGTWGALGPYTGAILPRQTNVLAMGGKPDLKHTLDALVRMGKISQRDADSLQKQLTLLKSQLPGLEAKIKAQLDPLVASGQITAKQEKDKLSSIHNSERDKESQLRKLLGG